MVEKAPGMMIKVPPTVDFKITRTVERSEAPGGSRTVEVSPGQNMNVSYDHPPISGLERC